MYFITRGSVARGLKAIQSSESHGSTKSRLVSSRCADTRDLLSTDEEEPAQGMGNGDGLAPVPAVEGLDFLQVALADPENDLFCGDVIGAGPGQEWTEVAESAGADEIEGSDFLAELLIAADEDASVRKFKITNHFREKGGFLDIRFD